MQGASHKLGGVKQAVHAGALRLTAAAADKARALDSDLHDRLEAAKRTLRDGLHARERAPAGEEAEGRQREPAEGPKPLRVLFIGDSIVTGVGCVTESGPVLARRFAQVRWFGWPESWTECSMAAPCRICTPHYSYNP